MQTGILAESIRNSKEKASCDARHQGASCTGWAHREQLFEGPCESLSTRAGHQHRCRGAALTAEREYGWLTTRNPASLHRRR